MKNTFRLLLKSFGYAFNGLFVLIKEERNAKIHLIAAILILIAGLFFSISAIEWLFIVLAIAIVFITEAINTSIENTIDFISTKQDPKIAKIKDIAAGAV